MAILWHSADPAYLRESISFTAAEFGFAARLLEKDYFCSVVLEYLAATDESLVFKGGTSLSKVHGAFYRLSEDLDFSISTALDSNRTDRSRSSAVLKAAITAVPKKIPGLRVIAPVQGANNSRQYNATLGYESLVDSHLEEIRVEVAIREPILVETPRAGASTALLDPATGQMLVPIYQVRCLSYKETMAEKLRAALCRDEVAIRDFFDVDHAIRRAALDPQSGDVLELLRRKLLVPGTGMIDVSEARAKELGRQVDAQLRPVLREKDFKDFDLDRAVATIREVARAVENQVQPQR